MATRKKPLSATQLAEANLKQLQIEVEIPKIKTSVAIADLQTYIEAHQDEDYLVRGFDSSPKKNPFRKKKLKYCEIF